jgi:hypothetical protein
MRARCTTRHNSLQDSDTFSVRTPLLYSLSLTPSELLSCFDLPPLTGHTQGGPLVFPPTEPMGLSPPSPPEKCDWKYGTCHLQSTSPSILFFISSSPLTFSFSAQTTNGLKAFAEMYNPHYRRWNAEFQFLSLFRKSLSVSRRLHCVPLLDVPSARSLLRHNIIRCYTQNTCTIHTTSHRTHAPYTQHHTEHMRRIHIIALTVSLPQGDKDLLRTVCVRLLVYRDGLTVRHRGQPRVASHDAECVL